MDRPALGDGGRDPVEVVGEQHDVGDVARHVGAPGPHRHADVGRPQGGGVVDTVAGHGHDLAARLQRAHDPVLVGGRHAGEHVDLVHQRAERVGAHLVHVRGIEHVRRAVAEVELAVDGGGGAGVIPGEEDRANAGAPAGADRGADAGPDRVGERGEADPDEGVELGRRRRRRRLEGQAEHAQAAGGDAVVDPAQLGPRVGGERALDAVVEPSIGPGQDLLGRALDHHDVAGGARVDGGHPVVAIVAPADA